MAKSIKLGADTYLDASGVTVNSSGTTLASGLTIVNFTLSEAITDANTQFVTLLNNNNSSIPSNKLVLVKITTGSSSNQYALLLVYKTNDSYGVATGLSYYSSSEYRLSNGTWVLRYPGAPVQTSFTENGITFTLAKIGGICTLSALSGGLTSAVSANTAFATIPSGWRPKIGCEVMESSGGKRMSIGTSGAIQFSSAQTAGTYVRFTVTYVLA